MADFIRDRYGEMSLVQKLLSINWLFVLLLVAIAGVGFAMLYSVAGGDLQPWAGRQMGRFGVALVILLLVAVSDIRSWMRAAYPAYFAAFALLVYVAVAGRIGMGAQRWVDLGFFQLQPSEVMKVALILALARYFHGLGNDDVRRPAKLIPPVLLIAAPVLLVLRQPDLGTAVLLAMSGLAIFFLAGVSARFFWVLVVGVAAALPLGWQFLYDYQKERVLVFLNPERDPMGAGYHILQSKIAMGSGGVFGRGFMQGTQSHLNFLPEKQTDFIFTTLAEETGLLGGLGLLGLYFILLLFGVVLGTQARSQFSRLLILGLMTTYFLYVFINIAMVTGLVPVVGVPLPLVSYGGTSMMTLMFGFGLVMSAYVHREVEIGRKSI